jgi:diaminohydroxyphosphoribosylaminopyrimidine deaminase/5-amino-6-(5-phosphoribosylamino)uracil reductase
VGALKMAGDDARGAVLYANLEPCFHHGKTPPCLPLILKSGIKGVVLSTKDPNPLVDGRSIRSLRKAGIDVKVGLLREEARRLNAPFYKLHEKGLPYVIAKWAMTLDGRIATKKGDSKWISCRLSRRFARSLRRDVDAVLVGINTVLADDPRLLPSRHEKIIRVIMDSQARLPSSSFLVKSARKICTIVACGKDAPLQDVKRLQQSGCHVIRFRKLGLRALLRRLARKGISKLLIEGGGRILGSAFDEGVVDEVMVFISPKIVGGEDAISPVEGKGVKKIVDALKLKEYTIKRSGEDLMIRGILR